MARIPSFWSSGPNLYSAFSIQEVGGAIVVARPKIKVGVRLFVMPDYEKTYALLARNDVQPQFRVLAGTKNLAIIVERKAPTTWWKAAR